jgi:hypothetical protein
VPLDLRKLGYIRLDGSNVGRPGFREVFDYLVHRSVFFGPTDVDGSRWEFGLFRQFRFSRAVCIFREGGVPVYWVARCIFIPVKTPHTPNMIKRCGNIWTPPKVLSSASRTGGLSRSEVIFAHDVIRDNPECEVVIGEGIFDAIALTSPGRIGTAALGKTVSRGWVEKLLSLGVHRVTVCLDPDALAEAARLALSLSDAGVETRLVEYPVDAALDPSDLGPHRCSSLLDRASLLTPGVRTRLLAAHGRRGPKSRRIYPPPKQTP